MSMCLWAAQAHMLSFVLSYVCFHMCALICVHSYVCSHMCALLCVLFSVLSSVCSDMCFPMCALIWHMCALIGVLAYVCFHMCAPICVLWYVITTTSLVSFRPPTLFGLFSIPRGWSAGKRNEKTFPTRKSFFLHISVWQPWSLWVLAQRHGHAIMSEMSPPKRKKRKDRLESD